MVTNVSVSGDFDGIFCHDVIPLSSNVPRKKKKNKSHVLATRTYFDAILILFKIRAGLG
jgi:hypothetical protein